MAGITTSTSSTFPFNPVLTHSQSHSSKTTPYSSFSSLDSSKLFGLRLHISRPDSLTSFAFPSSSIISARYGGGRRGRPRKSDPDDELALDVSSIRSVNVRLIDDNQNMVGVVSKGEAIQMAEDAELDLVVLSPDADPPVVRIMDYNKYRYEMQKKKKGQQKKSAATRVDLKELKMGYKIDQHDYGVRLKAARKFLNDGDKVKVIVNLKGRENEFRNMAIELIRRFQNDIGELATEESKNFRDRNIFITLVPNKALLQKTPEPPKKKEKSTTNEISAGV